MPGPRRPDRRQAEPDLETLAGRLLFGVHEQVLGTLATAGFGDIGSRHAGAVAFLDEDGVRPGDLARLIGRSKQTTGATLDELERSGYVTREPDPADRRARLVVPTPRGRELMAAFDDAVEGLELRLRSQIGATEYDTFVSTLRRVITAGLGSWGDAAPSSLDTVPPRGMVEP